MSHIDKIGPLRKWKHEAYAQARASGKTLEASSKAADLSGHRGNALVMENRNHKNNIAARILELRAENFKETDVDSFFITGCLAKEAVDPDVPPSVRVSALKTLADIAGLRGQRFKGDEGIMPREERDALLRKLLAASQAESLGPLIDISSD